MSASERRPGDPEVSVVIPTRNRLEYLKEALASVLAQTASMEVVVVDDASSDGTALWLSSQSDPRLRVEALERHGERSAARNLGLTRARGRFVLFLDDDDRLRPGAIPELAAALRSHPRAVAAAGGVLLFDESGQMARLRHVRRSRVTDVSADVMLGWMAPPGTTMFRKETLERVGGWPAGLTQGEDQDLLLRTAAAGPFAVLASTVLEYRKHEGQRRPEATYEIERELRERFIDTLQGEARLRAERILGARLRRQQGIDAWRRNDQRVAGRAFLAAARAAPGLVTSPISGRRMRSLILRGAAGYLLGSRVTSAAQRFLWALRRRLGRAPGGAEPLLPRAADSSKDKPRT